MNLLKKIPRKIKIVIITLPLLLLYTFISSVQYVSAISSDLSESVFRLHIIANSNSKEDQDLKYKVRDNIINYMNTLCSSTNSKEEVISIANEHLEDFKQIAIDTIKENGFDYNVSIEINNVFFPTKTYGDISLPEGYYDALRIKIGNASGQNWWCVMFPPLCFVDVSTGIVPEESKDLMKENLTDEEYNLICTGNNSKDNSDIEFKFKIVEILNHTKLITAKN